MVLGIPNVGKSTFINKVSGRKSAKAEDRPGVTRTKQWVPVDKTLELLDTPGILWPKFEDSSVGVRLAFTGAIRDEVVDIEELAMRLMDYLAKLSKPSRSATSSPFRKRTTAMHCSKRRGASAAF